MVEYDRRVQQGDCATHRSRQLWRERRRVFRRRDPVDARFRLFRQTTRAWLRDRAHRRSMVTADGAPGLYPVRYAWPDCICDRSAVTTELQPRRCLLESPTNNHKGSQHKKDGWHRCRLFPTQMKNYRQNHNNREPHGCQSCKNWRDSRRGWQDQPERARDFTDPDKNRQLFRRSWLAGRPLLCHFLELLVRKQFHSANQQETNGQQALDDPQCCIHLCFPPWLVLMRNRGGWCPFFYYGYFY